MNKATITFKIFSVLRLLCIPLIFILSKLWSDSIPDTGWFKNGLNIQFEWWEYALMYLIAITFCLNTITGLLISFNPPQLIPERSWQKTPLRIFYFIELIMLPFLIYFAIENISDNFFPRERTILDDAFGLIFQSPPNEKKELIEKFETVNYSLFVLCSLVFVCLFWLVYKERKKKVADLNLLKLNQR